MILDSNLILKLWLLYVTFITANKTYSYIASPIPTFSNGNIINLQKYTLLWHNLSLYFLQAYLTLEPIVSRKLPYSNIILNLIIISNYLLILPHHHHLGGIPSLYAIIINNIGMISLLFLFNYYRKNRYIKYMILFILSVPSILVMKDDIRKYL